MPKLKNKRSMKRGRKCARENIDGEITVTLNNVHVAPARESLSFIVHHVHEEASKSSKPSTLPNKTKEYTTLLAMQSER